MARHEDPEPAEATWLRRAGRRDDGAIRWQHDGDAAPGGPLESTGALHETDDSGDGPIRFSDHLDGLAGVEPPPGVLEDPPWDLVPDDNGGVGRPSWPWPQPAPCAATLERTGGAACRIRWTGRAPWVRSKGRERRRVWSTATFPTFASVSTPAGPSS